MARDAKGRFVKKSPDTKIIAYKAFDKNLCCSPNGKAFQYEVGKTYTHDGDVVRCTDQGFHSCENPFDVLNYYDLTESRFAVVEVSGKIDRKGNDTKIASGEIHIKAELSVPEFIKSAVKWAIDNAPKVFSGNDSKLAASGNYSKLAASGNASKLAASGNASKLAASGNASQLAASGNASKLAASGNASKLAASGNASKLAASGDDSKLAASGNASKLAASGDDSKLAASGNASIASAAAYNCRAKAGSNGAISLAWYDGERPRISVAYIGENGIKPDTWYELNRSGEFVEVK